MPPNDDYFEQALSEYRERTWDPTDFADLPTDVQSDIMDRAVRIQAANDRLRDFLGEAA